MSDSETFEPVTVSSDGLTVAKRFEADEFPVPAIAFRIESHRSEPVTITLVDQVPDDVAVEDLGFHPEYGSEYWTIDDDLITFEREIEANADYTTVYGIRATGTDNVEMFLGEPTIESVDPPLEEDPDEIVDSGTGTDVVKEVISGDSDVVPGLDDDSDDEIETLDLADPQSEGAEDADDSADATATSTAETGTSTAEPSSSDPDATDEPDTAETDSSDDAATDDGASSPTRSVARALAAEFQQGTVADPVRTVLSRELGGGSSGGGDGSTDARIKHLQNEVSDLQAYTDALEEFLDENGEGDEMIEQFQSELEEFGTELESLRSGQAESQERIDSVADEVESVKSTTERLESDIGSVRDQIEDTQSEISDLREEIEAMDGVDERVETIESRIDDEVESLESDLDDLKAWREQLTSVLGADES